MKSFFVIIIALLLSYQTSSAQIATKSKEFFHKDFDWTITIPEHFESVNPEQWKAMQNKGADAIEKTYGEGVENHTKTIFVFRSDQFNYFEANHQAFDTEKNGNYDENVKGLNQIVYNTFKSQMANVKLDSLSSKETISDLVFNKFKISVYLPNNMVMNKLMYSRLFGKQDFTVNMLVLDEEKQKDLLAAWILRNLRVNSRLFKMQKR